MDSQRFAGRTIIVTGAGSGIGRATATSLLEGGATVVANDVDGARLDQLATELGSDRLVTVAGDICAPETVDALVTAAGPGLDGLANVAGIMDGFLPAGEVDDETWDRVFRVNVTGPMRLIRAALPALLDGGGSIVNVASEAALRGSAAGAAYTASKHAVVGLTKNTAFMYGPQGVRTNAVAPGPTATGIEADVRSPLGAGRIFPLLQALAVPMATADDLAAVITWLLSDAARNVNGAIVPSDAGWSAV